MLIVLPPSEGKTVPTSGAPLDLDVLGSPALNPTRRQLIGALQRVCRGRTDRAMDRLGLGATQADAVERNATLEEQPCGRADEVYTGVLYAAWDPARRSEAARQRAETSVAVCSALFGLVRPGDPIPAYRLSASVTLPRLGTMASRWRPVLGPELERRVGDGLLVDLRSGAYVALHKPTGDLAARTATVRVLSERDGTRTVVSHFNKATKGHLVRALLEDGADPASPAELATALRDLGWTVEQDGTRLDVVVTDVPHG
ncbi:peroxide stress protein YaaA [Aeromicrobium halocynthiae]|uniref:Peroxide stress protein YaaA n=1 Tax=Aeromicrobium halocynthiae TaxID=560557 RepID=A0ABN2W0A3_9ACTN